MTQHRWPLLLALTLAGCAPSAQNPASPPRPTALIDGGHLEGRWVYQAEQTFPLPETPLAVAAQGTQVWAAYPYQLLVFRDGVPSQSLALPGLPTFVRVSPGVVVGLGSSLFRPDQGQLPYPALDAVVQGTATYWVNARGLYLGSRLLLEGSFVRLLARGGQLAALSPQGRVQLWPNGDSFDLGQPLIDAIWPNDLYLLTPQGVARYSPGGLRLGFLGGNFLAIQSNGSDLLLLQERQVIEVSPTLEVR
jgi:hypothetical protein